MTYPRSRWAIGAAALAGVAAALWVLAPGSTGAPEPAPADAATLTPAPAPAEAPSRPAAYKPLNTADPAIRADLQARIAAAYAEGGGAEPIPFPPGHDPATDHAAAEAWADALAERCPSGVDPLVDIDCGEFPCAVTVAWAGDVSATDVVCDYPSLYKNQRSSGHTIVGDTTIHTAMFAIGPPEGVASVDDKRWERRRDLRGRVAKDAMVAWVVEQVKGVEEAGEAP